MIPELRLDQLAKVLARPEGLVVGHEHELARCHGAQAREQIGPQQPQHALAAAPHAESRRIDDHEVVAGLLRIARQAPKMFREVILRRVRQDAHLHAVQCGVAKRPGQIVAVGIDVGDFRGSARGGRDAEGARIGEEIQHARAARGFAHEQARLGSVEVDPEVVRRVDADLELQTTFGGNQG